MKAETQYTDYIGTIAADISDHIDLNQFLTKRGVSLEEYEAIGARLNSSGIYGSTASIICIDKIQSVDDKKHIVQLDFNEKFEKEEFFSLFKRFELIITGFGKYQDCEIDEIKRV